MDRLAIKGVSSKGAELSSNSYSTSLAPDSPSGAPGLLVQVAAAQNKRKEKARIAARARRSQEASIIMEMASELHISQEKMRRIDKATIIKLAIDYIKAFSILCRLKSSLGAGQHLQEQPAPQGATHSVHIHIQSPLKVQDDKDDHDGDGDGDEEQAEQQKHQQHQSQHQHQHQRQHRHQNRHPHLNQHQVQHLEEQHSLVEQQPEQQPPPLAQQTSQPQQVSSMPKLSTSSIFAPRTNDVDTHFLIINEKENGESSFVLKPDTELLDDDDLTHLAPQAGDISISLDVEPLDGIVLDKGLFMQAGSPPAKRAPVMSFY